MTGHHQHSHTHGRGPLAVIHGVCVPHSHDTADKVDSALEASDAGIRAVKISLVVLLITAAIQVGIVAASGSVALAADTVHNFSDALTAIPLWIAFVLGRRAATTRFTYGYGRAEDLAGLLILVAIAISAVVAGVESIRRLVSPVPVEHLGWVALAGAVGFVGNEAVAIYRIRVGRRIGSAALVADGLHARTDGFTSLAVVAGAAGVAAGFPIADPIVGIGITVAIVVVLIGAGRDVLRRLMDGVEPGVVDAAAAVLAQRSGTRVRTLRMRWIGHRLHADVELDIDPTLSLRAAHALAHGAEHDLIAHVPRVESALVHAYPAHDSPRV